MDGKADEHGLVLDVLLRVQPRLRSPPPDVRADSCARNRDAFPDPERDKDGPPGPVDHLQTIRSCLVILDRNHTGGVFISPTIVCFEFNTRSSCNVKRMEKRRREVNTTNLLALNS